MVDTPVGKKCRDCAANRTHLAESTPRQVLLAFAAAILVAVPLGWLTQQLHLFLLAFPFGYAVGEAALRAGQRRRSLAMQIVTGVATVIGGVVGSALVLPHGPSEEAVRFVLGRAFSPLDLIVTVIATVVAVSRVRYI